MAIRKSSLYLIFALTVAALGSATTDAQTVIQNRKIETQLNVATTLEFEETEFSTVLHEIKDKHKINISVHQSAIDAGLGNDDLVTINMSGGSLRSALVLFLDKFECTYVVKDGFLQLMTKDESERYIMVKSYDCRKLLEHFKAKTVETVYYNGKPTDLPKGAVPLKDRKYVSEGKSVLNKQEKENETHQYFVHRQNLTSGQHLAHVIQKMCTSNLWSGPGEKGTITEVNGRLFIKQTTRGHQEIEQILELLKADLVSNNN